MYNRKIDCNQRDIVSALRKYGASVFVASHVGSGFPDLVVGYKKRTYLLEVKSKGGGLTNKQDEFVGNWVGHYEVVTTQEEALEVLIDGDISDVKTSTVMHDAIAEVASSFVEETKAKQVELVRSVFQNLSSIGATEITADISSRGVYLKKYSERNFTLTCGDEVGGVWYDSKCDRFKTFGNISDATLLILLDEALDASIRSSAQTMINLRLEEFTKWKKDEGI